MLNVLTSPTLNEKQLNDLKANELYVYVSKNISKKDDVYIFKLLGKEYHFKILTMSELLGCRKISENIGVSNELMLVARSITNFKESEILDMPSSVVVILKVALYHIIDLFSILDVQSEDDNKSAIIDGKKYIAKPVSASVEEKMERLGEYNLLAASIVSPTLTNDEVKKLPLSIGFKLQMLSMKANTLPDFL